MGRAVQPPAHYKPWLKLTAEQSPDKTPTTTSSTITLDPIPSLAGCLGIGAPATPPANRGLWLCNPGLSRVRARARRQRNAARLRRAHAACAPEGQSHGPPPRCLHRRCRAGRCSPIRELASSGTVVWPESPATPPRRFRAATAPPCLCLVCVSAVPPHHRWLLPITAAGCSLLAPLPWHIRPGLVPHTPSRRGGQHPPTHTQPSVATVTPSSPCLCLPPHDAL
jgi:hypothetical protein